MYSFTADSIYLKFESKIIFAGTYLAASAGDITGIMGLNGSGKSSLYKCLLGIHKTPLCTIHIDGKYISPMEILPLFGWLSQESFLPLGYPAAKSIALILGKERAAALIESDERIREISKMRGHALSTGQRRYLECLIILSLERPILLLDEPFSYVEPIYCEHLIKVIRAAAPGRVIFISDHLYQNIRQVCGQLRIIKGGMIYVVENKESGLERYGYIKPR